MTDTNGNNVGDEANLARPDQPRQSLPRPRAYNPSLFSMFMDYLFVIFLLLLSGLMAYQAWNLASGISDIDSVFKQVVAGAGVTAFAFASLYPVWFFFSAWIPQIKRTHAARARARK